LPLGSTSNTHPEESVNSIPADVRLRGSAVVGERPRVLLVPQPAGVALELEQVQTRVRGDKQVALVDPTRTR
jgi:hypothetical protein